MENTNTQGRSFVRRALAGAVATVGFVVAGASAAFAAPAPPDPGALAGSLANTAGGAYLDAIVDVLPVLVPFLAGLWALGFVWSKLRPKKKGL